jgi:hypothetical protein
LSSFRQERFVVVSVNGDAMDVCEDPLIWVKGMCGTVLMAILSANVFMCFACIRHCNVEREKRRKKVLTAAKREGKRRPDLARRESRAFLSWKVATFEAIQNKDATLVSIG